MSTITDDFVAIDPDEISSSSSRQQRQLSFFVGGATPDAEQIQLSGKLGCTHEKVPKGTKVIVSVVREDTGEVIGSRGGRIEAVSFKDKYDEDDNVETTTRILHVKV